jgi:hypothetical protein
VVIADAPKGWCRFELRLPLAAPVEPAQAAVASSSSPSALPLTVADPTPSIRA